MMNLEHIDVKRILERLKIVAPNLPGNGFVAGGAVAAIINHEIRGVESPIRDVDLFLPLESGKPFPLYSKDHFIPGFVPTSARCAKDFDFLENYTFRLDDTGYSIIKADRDDNLNLIYCTAGVETFEVDVLKGFDINCCQVGIDLITEKLFYTSDYEEFLESGKIYITNIGTPYHTAVRLFSKAKDMSGEFYFPTELEILYRAINCLKPGYTAQKVQSQDFRYLNDIDRHQLSYFFDITEDDSFNTMTLKKIALDRSSNLYPLSNCTSAVQFMAKVRAIRRNSIGLLPLLDEPISYEMPHYLENYQDVTLGDIEIRRDYDLAILYRWNIGQHCLHSRNIAFANCINKAVTRE